MVVDIRVICRCGVECRAVLPGPGDNGAVRCRKCGSHLFKFTVTQGYVYVLSNAKMPGLLKVGCTTRRVQDRVAELNAATGVPAPFTLEAYFPSPTPDQHELEVHKRLKGKRLQGKEFFEAGLEEVIAVVESVLQTKATYSEDRSDDSGRAYRCGLCKHEWRTPYVGRVFCPKCHSGNVS